DHSVDVVGDRCRSRCCVRRDGRRRRRPRRCSSSRASSSIRRRQHEGGWFHPPNPFSELDCGSPIRGQSTMAHHDDIAFIAHFIRRAGFGAGRDELEARVARGYDATVEELLHPEKQPPVDPYTLLRYQPSSLLPGGVPPMGNINYMYYLVTTQRPLEEKMTLFWHQVFAT